MGRFLLYLIMENFETPSDFTTKKTIREFEITYTDLMEASMGGPEVGTMSINGQLIPLYQFGGPWIGYGEDIIVPVRIRAFFGFSFKLAKINLKTLAVVIFGKSKDFYFLDKVDDDKVYFFEDLDKTDSNYIDFI